MSLAFECIQFYTDVLLSPVPISLRQRRHGCVGRALLEPGGRSSASRILSGLFQTVWEEPETAGRRSNFHAERVSDDLAQFATLPMAYHEQ